MRALVIGGNRFIGKSLVNNLLAGGFEVSVLNRGNQTPNYSGVITHLKADRSNSSELKAAIGSSDFDVVFDLICSDIKMAELAIETFAGRTTKYVLLSSTFVYPYGQNLSEEQFDPTTYQSPISGEKISSTETKKTIESLFARAPFKTLIARIPFVLGDGDTSQKIKKLIRMIIQKEAIYVPKKDSKFSVIHVEDLAQALVKLSLARFNGTVNVAAELPIAFNQVIKYIEEASFRPAKITEEAKAETVTAFSLKGDWYLDTSRLKSLDVSVRNPAAWLVKLVEKNCQEVEKEFSG